MNCPKCLNTALKTETAGGVEIDRCPSCHGLWLDMLELEQLAAHPPKALIEDDRKFHAAAYEEGARLACPRCEGTYLIKLNSRLRPGTIVDSCKVCHGNWLDAGELARLTGQELRDWIQAVFRG